MHRYVVPTEEKLATLERTVGLLPSQEQVRDGRRNALVKLREASPQQDAEVDALRIVVELSAVHRQPWSSGEGIL
jgi:hypothetical protein